MTEAECACLAKLAHGKVVLEIGSWYGRSTIALASTAACVHAVDRFWVGPPGREKSLNCASILLDNLRHYDVEECVVVHVGYSTEVLPLFGSEAFDLVFIDAMHDRFSVERDIGLALPLTRTGGQMAFHDYGVEGVDFEGVRFEFGVRDAVDALAERSGSAVEVTETLAVVQLPGLVKDSHRIRARRAVAAGMKRVAASLER